MRRDSQGREEGVSKGKRVLRTSLQRSLFWVEDSEVYNKTVNGFLKRLVTYP